MLKLRNLIENDQIVSELLENYEFKSVKFGFCRSSSNVVYWVNGDDRLYFLRYTTEDERTAEMILGEIDYLLFLQTHGINANQPVKTKTGEYLIKRNGYLAVLFTGIKGISLDDIDLTSEIAEGWGRELGRMHSITSTLSEHIMSPGHKRPDYTERFSFIRAILAQENDIELSKEADWLESAFDHLLKTRFNYGLCHYDFELDNVFYDKENNQFGSIDFDDCMFHFYAIDYVQVMMCIEEDIPEESRQWVKEAVQKGYLEYCTLPSKEEIELACEFVLLLGYAKISYSLYYPPVNAPDWMSEIEHKLRDVQVSKRNRLIELANQHL